MLSAAEKFFSMHKRPDPFPSPEITQAGARICCNNPSGTVLLCFRRRQNETVKIGNHRRRRGIACCGARK
jgi:hypothetical protein